MADSSAVDPRARLHSVLLHFPDIDESIVTPINSNRNEVWDAGHCIIRISPSIYERAKSQYDLEQSLLRELPRSITGYSLLADGTEDNFAWNIVEKAQGVPWISTWQSLNPDQLASIFHNLANRLVQLHEWYPSDDGARLLDEIDTDPSPHASLFPLPVARAYSLLKIAVDKDYVDVSLARRLESRLDTLAKVDPFTVTDDRVLCHNDSQFSNVLLIDDKISALLDFEWARLAPPVMEIPVWLHVLREAKHHADSLTHRTMMQAFWENFTPNFACENFEETMWLCQLSFAIHGVNLWPPDAEALSHPEHYYYELQKLVDAPPALLEDNHRGLD